MPKGAAQSPRWMACGPWFHTVIMIITFNARVTLMAPIVTKRCNRFRCTINMFIAAPRKGITTASGASCAKS